MQWAGFFIKEMQKNRIEIPREILDNFLNLSYVIKTMTNLEGKYYPRRNNSLEFTKNLEESKNNENFLSKKKMVYKQENDWLEGKEEEEHKAQNVWEKFRKLNVNAMSFNPKEIGKNNKSMKVESELFMPQK